MSVPEFSPLSATLPYWPTQLFSEPEFLDEIGVADFKLRDQKDALSFAGTLLWFREIVFGIAGMDGFSIALLSAGGHAAVPFEVDLAPDVSLSLPQITFSFRFASELLQPVLLQDGKWVVQRDADGHAKPAEILVGGVGLTVNGSGDLALLMPSGAPKLSLPAAQIGETGLVIEIDDLSPYFSRAQSRPAGLPADFRGFTVDSIKLHLPSDFDVPLAPQSLIFTDVRIGTGGFSGKVDGQWTPTFNSATGAYDGGGAGTLFGMPFGLTSLSLEFKQNVPVGSELKGELVMPFFDQRVAVDLSIGFGGSISLALSAVQIAPATMTNGLLTFEKTGVLRIELDSLGFELKAGVFLAKLSGQITPLAGGIAWPSFDVRELSIDSKGHLHLDGGFIPLPKSYSIDFHGAKLAITQFGMGRTDDGGKYVAMSGAVKLVEGLPAGASVEGLRITWYDDGRHKVAFNGIGVSFKTPAVQFDGHVSYEENGNEHRFTGDLTLVIPAANNLTLVGKAVFGKDAKGTKYFAIYVEGDFGTGIPLWATGLSLYGFAGLLAINYAPGKPADMAWYSIDKSKSWFHKPDKGVIDIVKKWKPETGAFALGAGVKIGTGSDNGHAFNGTFLLLLLCPGPVLMIDGSARFLAKRDDTSEPPFHGLIVLDNRAGYFLVGLDARWKSDKSQGNLADISGSMEVFFDYHDPKNWHLWLGKKDPMAQRIQARIAKVFTANAYFMLDGKRLQLGAWVGQSKHFKWGPVKADMEAWLAADAAVNFKPPQLNVKIQFHGYLAVQVFKFKLGLGLDAILSADVFKPFHILGELQITIETRFKNFHIQLRLEWGPRREFPDLHTPDLLPVLNYGIAYPKSSIEWQLSDPAALPADPAGPLVPMDCQPYVTFNYPMRDPIGVGVNPGPDPGWMIIGDPDLGTGSARARYSLTKIELYRDGTLVAACPQPSPQPSPSVGKIFGAWAPSVPGTSGGQNKLLLRSTNPLDFANKTDSWNPWLSSNLPGYPCPDTTPETVCVDFKGRDQGEKLYGAWWDPQKLDFRFNWSDAGPHPIVPVSPAVAGFDRGLLFPAATPGKHYRAYVSNFASNTVSLVDLPTRKVIATIPVGLGPRQVVLSPDRKRAYVCNQGVGDNDAVIVIDTATNQRVGAPIAVIKSPMSIAITPDGKRAFVPSGSHPVMSVIDLQSLAVTTVQLPGAAHQAILSPDGKKLYVMIPVGAIAIFAADTLALIKSVGVRVGGRADGPHAMVFHPSAPRAWISFPVRGTVCLFDTSRDELTALEAPIGRQPWDLALSPDGGRLYVGDLRDDIVSVLDTTTLDVLTTIATPGPLGLTMTPDGAALLVANYSANTIAIIDPIRNQVVAPGIAAGQGSDSFAVMEAPRQILYRALLVDPSSQAVSVLDLQTGQVLASIPVGRGSLGIALAPDGKRAYVNSSDDNMVTVIDTVANTTIGAPIPIGTKPGTVAITPDGKRGFAISGAESDPNARNPPPSTMSVIDLTLSRLAATVAIPSVGDNVTLSADGTKGYALCGPARALVVFSPSSMTVTKTVPTSSAAYFMALHPRLPRAFVSFPNETSVREFDTNTEQFTGTVIRTEIGIHYLCFSPDGSRLFMCNLNNNTISVIDSATNGVMATIPIQVAKTPKFTDDGSTLVVVSRTSPAIVMIDPVANRVLGNPIRLPAWANGFVLQAAAKTEEPLPLVPVDVTIDVPAGSSSVEVTWAGKGPLLGVISDPVTLLIAMAATGTLKFDAMDPALAGSAVSRQGINQIRLHSDSEWTLIRVCVTKLPFAGGLAEQQRLNDLFNQQVDFWYHPTDLLEPGKSYELHVDWLAEVEGIGELNGWSESFSNRTTLKFQTALPPSLGLVSDPRVPQPAGRPAATGLKDLSLYVRRTIPVTQTPKDEIPALTKPVLCGYDITVEFNEPYVDQMYQLAGRDLDLLLFDRNNQLVRDPSGPLIIVEGAWPNAPTLVLTDTQARWIDMFNANTCTRETINPQLIPTSKVFQASEAHVLAADTVYEARLVPELMHQRVISGAAWTTETSGAQIWNPPSASTWADYRVSVLVTLKTSNSVGVLFRYTNGSYYEFTIDPAANRRRLTLVNGGTTTLAEDYYVYQPGKDDPYRIHIEAVGSRILVSQNGVLVFAVTDTVLPTDPVVPTGTVVVPKGSALPSGTVGLRPAGSTVFNDLAVSDLNAAAPIAYGFRFTTSKFTNFYHQIHSFQDETWAQDVASPLDLAAAVSSSANGVLASATPAQPIKDDENRAYDRLASLVLGSASAQDPPQVEVTRVTQGGAILGWLLCSPEPIGFSRTDITLFATSRILTGAETPRAVKIAEAELGDTESITVLARETVDLSAYSIQYRQMPSALADEIGNQGLRKGGIEIAGDQTWSDYRASVTCSANQPGGIGLQFRYVDAQNYYAFTYNFISGVQQIVKTVKGTTTVLASAPGDPAPGLPHAPSVRLAVSAHGSQITGYRAGQKVVAASDADLPSGGAGVFASGNASAQFDNFEVHRLPNESYALFRGQFSTTTVTNWQNATDGSGLKLYAVANSSWADIVLRARVRRASGGTTGLLLRYQNPQNHYRLLFTDTERRLERIVSGSSTTLWSAPSPLPADRVCEIAVTMIGAALGFFQDSVPACEVADPSFASGSLGLCALPGADLAISQLLVYPPELAFSNWMLRDNFQELAADAWNFIDAGDQGGPSKWQVTNGRLTQTSAIHDSSPDPIRQRGTVALLKRSSSTGVRLVTRLLSQQSGAIGLVFGYRDADNFCRFSMDRSAGYRRLVSCIGGQMTLLWGDTATFDLGRDYVLALDIIDGYITVWLDGERVFQRSFSAKTDGALGLYCCGNPGASFADFRVGAPAWITYYTFGSELPLSAGNRVKVASANGTPAPNRRTSLRFAANLDDPAFDRLPPNGARLRVVTADRTVQHGRDYVPATEFTTLPFQALRKADQTGIFLAPASSIAPSQTVRLSFRYHRDDGVVAFTEVGESGDELVFIDLAPSSRN